MMYERPIYNSTVVIGGNTAVKVFQQMNSGNIPQNPIKVIRLIGDKYVYVSEWKLSEADEAVAEARRITSRIIRSINNGGVPA